MNPFKFPIQKIISSQPIETIAYHSNKLMNRSVPVAKVKFKAPGVLGKLGSSTAEIKLPVSTITTAAVAVGLGLATRGRK